MPVVFLLCFLAMQSSHSRLSLDGIDFAECLQIYEEHTAALQKTVDAYQATTSSGDSSHLLSLVGDLHKQVGRIRTYQLNHLLKLQERLRKGVVVDEAEVSWEKLSRQSSQCEIHEIMNRLGH